MPDNAERKSDSIEVAARFVIGQPGWIERALGRHVPRPGGDCAGCGTYRPTEWPCVLVHIARRAQGLIAEARSEMDIRIDRRVA